MRSGKAVLLAAAIGVLVFAALGSASGARRATQAAAQCSSNDTGPRNPANPLDTPGLTGTHPLADRSELRVEDVLDEPFPGIVDWCDPGWLGYWGLDSHRGAPARRTDDGAVTPEEVASIVASGRAITTVPEIVAVPFAHLGIRAIPLIDAEPAVLTLVWPDGNATPLVEDLVRLARQGLAEDAAESEPSSPRASYPAP